MVTQAPHFLLFSEAGKTVFSEAGKTAFSEAGKTADEDRVRDRHGAQRSRAAADRFWHFVLRTPDGETRLEVADMERDASEERLELLAVVRGLEALDQPSKVTLMTSSSSIRRGLRFGLELWRQNRWHWERFGTMAPIKNADLWQRIDRAMKFHDIECRLVRFDPPADDLTGPGLPSGSDQRLRPARSASLADRHPSEPRFRGAAVSRFSWLVRRLLGWCGLCRSEPTLVIAAH